MHPGSRRLLLAVSPRLLGDSLRALLADGDGVDVVQVEPGVVAVGPFDLALVDAGTVADAAVVVELLPSGGCVVIGEGEEGRFIELRDAVGLLALVRRHLGVDLPERDVEDDPGAAAGGGLDVEGAVQ